MLEPWDLCRGRDVLKMHGELMTVKNRATTWRHGAPNCSTFSRARERPIEGVKHPPKPLRNESFPEGIPEVLFSLPPHKRRKVRDDTNMAIMAAEDFLQARADGKWFSLERPKNSLARHLPGWKLLESLEGVMVTEYHTCMFHPPKGGSRNV